MTKGVPPLTRRRVGLLKRMPEEVSARVYKTIFALTPHKRCPVCQKRDAMFSIIVSSLVESFGQPEMVQALQASDGLCVPHLRLAQQSVQDVALFEKLIDYPKTFPIPA